MKGYASIARMRFLLLLQYRAAALAGICAPLLFGLVKVMVFDAFYRSTTAPQPMSYQQAVTYVWLGQALLGMVPWDGDAEVLHMIRSGNVAYELCRPLDLHHYWFCRSLAMRTAPTLLRAVPIFCITLLLPSGYGMKPPASFAATLAWALSLVGALLVACALTNLMNISSLWTISGEGVARLLPAVVIMCSGLIVPIPMFPAPLQAVLRLLPFSGLVDSPSRFYTGHILPSEVLPFFLHQLVWAGVLIVFGQQLVARAMKRLVVQGG